MPRKARMIVEGETAVYHVMSRTALDGFVIGDAEKDYLMQHIRHLSSVYFAEILTFCLMGNHFHLVVRMHTGSKYSDENIKERFIRYHGDKKVLMPGRIPLLKGKWEKLSEFMKEIKQGFSRYYNKKHNRRGFFWCDRFKSVLVENGETLINLLAYVDLNPVRAGLVETPDEYRWNGLGRHIQTGNRDRFLSLDFGLEDCVGLSSDERLARYRRFVYEAGGLKSDKLQSINPEAASREVKKKFVPGSTDRFLAKTRYFTDSGIIGSREFVRSFWQELRRPDDNPDKIPVRIAGLSGLYSLKRLSG